MTARLSRAHHRTTRALLAASLLVFLGCGGTRPCRSGTLFLSLKFSALTQADLLTIDVTVDGGPKKTLSQTLAHASAGSLELTFPSGYLAGSTVIIQATLSQGATRLATSGPVLVTLSPGCSSRELDFGGADAGGMGGANVGSGGDAPGAGGAAGAIAGPGGAGGAPTNRGGAAGGETSSGGAGGAIGSGGAVGGATSSGGVAGGVPPAGGHAGTAAGGNGGMPVGGKGGAGGSGCRPTSQTETCYNNVDDNCDGKTDCEDAACMPVAQCVALDPASGLVGQSVAATAACPSDAPSAKTLQNGVTAAGCTGCACGAGTSTLVCSAEVYGYGLLDLTCGNNTGGTLMTTLTSTQTCAALNQNVTGIRASVFQGVPAGACLPLGTPTKGTPTWNASAKFCGVPSVGGGCRQGYSCVPRTVATAGACVLVAGTQTCPATATKSSAWFIGVTDNRTCGACQCGAPTGGDCSSLLIRADSSATCGGNTLGYVASGDKLCNLSALGVSPGLQFTGSAQPVSCVASSTLSGSLTATGPQTLCCL